MSTMVQHQNVFTTHSILGVSISVSNYDETVMNSLSWAREGESRALFFVNVHVIMEAYDDPIFRDRLNNAGVLNPDGMPLVWALRALGEKNAQRVYGPDTMVAMLAAAEAEGTPVGFYGSTQKVIDSLIDVNRLRYPKLKIVFSESPPYRLLTSAEDADVVNRISASGAKLLFVGLGCPKQETWIMDHLGRVPAVMLGVGAAFDFLAGTKLQAPRWMMRCGFEWIFRLFCEPRRLGSRYFKHNPRFIALLLKQLVTGASM